MNSEISLTSDTSELKVEVVNFFLDADGLSEEDAVTVTVKYCGATREFTLEDFLRHLGFLSTSDSQPFVFSDGNVGIGV